jgi:hypothetical protein
MGLGWFLCDRGVPGRFGHGGQTIGYLSQLVSFEASKLVMVALVNAVNGGEVLNAGTRAATEAAGLQAAPIEACTEDLRAADYAGLYDGPFWLFRVKPGATPNELVIEHEARPWNPRRWQPPPPPAARWRLFASDRAVVEEPEAERGSFREFGRDASGKVVWLRSGLRVAPRAVDAGGRT